MKLRQSARILKGNPLAAVRASASVVAVLTLTGCENIAGHGPIALQADSEDLVFTVCKEIDVDAIDMSTRANLFAKWVSFWTDTPTMHLTKGSAITTADPRLSAPDAVFQQPPLDPGTELSVLLSSTEDGESIVGVFVIPPEGLPTSEWLQTDASVTNEPCV